MYKLLIVDDEFLVVEGLKKLVNWEKYLIHIVGEASNGNEGVALAKSKNPDIIITDVNMPDMSGLDMIKLIKDSNPSIRFIVLSGYDDFNWAKRAFQYGVIDYLLKPLDFQQLDAALEKVINNINYEKVREEDHEKITNALQKSKGILKKETILKLIKGEAESIEIIKEQLEYLNIALDNRQRMVMLFEARNYREKEDNSEGDFKALIKEVILWLEEKKLGYGIEVEDDKSVFILNALETTEQWAEILTEYICEKFPLSKHGITIGIGGIYTGLSRVKYSYIEAEQAVRYKYLSENPVVFYSKIQNQLTRLDKIDLPVNIEKSVIEGLMLANREMVNQSLESYYEQIKGKKIEILSFKNIIIEFLFGIKRELSRIKIDLSKVFIDVFQEIYSIESKNSIDDVWKSVRDFIEKVLGFIEHTEKTSSKQVVQEIMLYIEQNYTSGDISLNEIAERIYLTPNYISMLIKQETGENFSDMVVRKRMEKAKEFLYDVTLRTYEIAEKVGYSDPNYFSRTFKKVIGMSPGDFRNKFCS